MVFNSMEFALFLPIVWVIYWRLSRRNQNVLLLVSSLIFYGAWDHRFLYLLVFSIVIDYVVGLRLEAANEESQRKKLLALSVVTQIGLLAVFKYYGFFVDSAARLLENVGFHPDPPVLKLLLPIGISFYTFHTLSYTIDVYRRRIPPTHDFLSFAVFVAYFPQLVAGPIARARYLLPQIERARAFPKAEQIGSGIFLMLLGLFKKVAIADAVGQIADAAFESPGTASSVKLAIGMYAFALQIYGDFSGYSDIARGCSRLFGIELMQNFEQPYLSRNITEFWRTWHISLSSWLHDYLYVPLGGNRSSRFGTYRNLMLTMLLGGLWHGAAWTFVIWGGLHGIFLSIHRRWGRYVPRGDPARVSMKDAMAIVATFHLVCVAWIFFRAPSFSVAMDYLRGLVAGVGRGLGIPAPHILLVLANLAVVISIDVVQRNGRDDSIMVRWRPVARGLAFAGLGLAVLIWSGGEARQFIYFQF